MTDPRSDIDPKDGDIQPEDGDIRAEYSEHDEVRHQRNPEHLGVPSQFAAVGIPDPGGSVGVGTGGA